MGKRGFRLILKKENRTLPRGVGSYWDLGTTHQDVHVKTPMGHGILEGQDKNPNAHGLYVLKVAGVGNHVCSFAATRRQTGRKRDWRGYRPRQTVTRSARR